MTSPSIAVMPDVGWTIAAQGTSDAPEWVVLERCRVDGNNTYRDIFSGSLEECGRVLIEKWTWRQTGGQGRG